MTKIRNNGTRPISATLGVPRRASSPNVAPGQVVNVDVDPQDVIAARRRGSPPWPRDLELVLDSGPAEGSPTLVPCRAATTGNLTALSGLQTIDGVALAEGDSVLVRAQLAGAQNGVYVASVGLWRRRGDAGQGALVPGVLVPVAAGSTYANTIHVLSSAGGAPIVVGTTAITVTAVSGGGGAIAPGAVGTTELADGAVTGVKIASALSDPGAATAGLRTLGTGAQQAAAGNDARLSNARTPTAHAATHATGQADAIAPASIGALATSQRNVTGGVAGLDANGRLDTATTGTVNDAFDLAVDVAPAFPAAPATNFGRIGVVEWVPQVRDFILADAAGSISFVERWFAGATKYSWAASQTATFNGLGVGIALAALGTFSVPAISADALGTRTRNRWVTTSTTTGLYAGPFSGNGTTGVGSARPGQLVGGVRVGGFYHAVEFAYFNDPTNISSFVGLGQSVPGGTATPVDRAHHAGLSFEGGSAPGSVVRFTRNNGSASGAAVNMTAGSNGVVQTLNRGPSTAPLLLSLFMPTEADILCVRVDRVDGPRNIVPVMRTTFDTQIPGSGLTAGLVHETYMRTNGTASAAPGIDVYRVFGFSGG